MSSVPFKKLCYLVMNFKYLVLSILVKMFILNLLSNQKGQNV